MLLMGVPAALGAGGLRRWREIWSAGRDAAGRAGDHLPAAGVLLDASRFALLALSRRRSATGATTDDIEWNGEAIP
jgi:hypothetical protein